MLLEENCWVLAELPRTGHAIHAYSKVSDIPA
jgi:hypothetical protein